VVTCAWPESQPPTVNATAADAAPERRRSASAVHIYARRLGRRGGDVHHAAEPGLLASRAVGRVLATFAGVVAAGLIIRRGPAEIVVAFLVVAAIGAMVAVRTSRWYVAPAFSALIVLLLSGATSSNAFDISFTERLVETAMGAALALTFGSAIPRLVHAVGDRDRLEA
jgi:Fusaric acid resistance protein-like